VASLRIKGGPELRARLRSIGAAGADLERAWAHEAAPKIASDAPRRTGALAASVQEGTSKGRGAVFGNYYGVILDRGTRAYPITAKSGGTLRFEYKGRTIFAKKVQRKRLRRRPFITRGAQAALESPAIGAAILKAWSRRSGKGRFSTVL
jgi:hypothetical protein